MARRAKGKEMPVAQRAQTHLGVARSWNIGLRCGIFLRSARDVFGKNFHGSAFGAKERLKTGAFGQKRKWQGGMIHRLKRARDSTR